MRATFLKVDVMASCVLALGDSEISARDKQQIAYIKDMANLSLGSEVILEHDEYITLSGHWTTG